MEILVKAVQVLIALSLLLVWLVRPRMETGYRGGDAKNMKEEFAVYGFPYWFMIIVGVLKVGFALLLIAGLWLPRLIPVSSIGIALLMAGAVAMHIRVKDPLKKSLPALSLFLLSLLVGFYTL
ncbi:MAG: DoxX family protein [Bacteroidales bacterium]|nr:DoxX family protein [Bacteroidales bacterium]